MLIALHCAHCGREARYDSQFDPTLPNEVAKIVQPHCDWCWDGQEPEGEDWFDVNGRLIDHERYYW